MKLIGAGAPQNCYSAEIKCLSPNLLLNFQVILFMCRYVESNPQYAECNVYLVKFRQLQVCLKSNAAHREQPCGLASFALDYTFWTSGLICGFFLTLQSRALGMIRSHVLSVLKNTSAQVNLSALLWYWCFLFFNMSNGSIHHNLLVHSRFRLQWKAVLAIKHLFLRVWRHR